jgi:hypothetical protein
LKKLFSVIGSSFLIAFGSLFVIYAFLFPVFGFMVTLFVVTAELKKIGWTGPEQIIPVLGAGALQFAASSYVCFVLLPATKLFA